MAFPADPDDRELAELGGFYWGVVVNRDDPERRGRVRAEIPGVMDLSGWLQPVGWSGAGAAGQGRYRPSTVGAPILVGFVQGDREEGFYMAGPPGAPAGVPDIPTAAASETSLGAADYDSYETTDFRVHILDRGPGASKLVLQSKHNNMLIEMDNADRSLTIQGETSVNIFCPNGQIDIRGGVVAIQGKQVFKLGRGPI